MIFTSLNPFWMSANTSVPREHSRSYLRTISHSSGRRRSMALSPSSLPFELILLKGCLDNTATGGVIHRGMGRFFCLPGAFVSVQLDRRELGMTIPPNPNPRLLTAFRLFIRLNFYYLFCIYFLLPKD